MSTDDVTAEELVKRLRKISCLVAAELAAADDPDAPGGDMAHSLAAVRSLQSLTDEILARLVTAARGRGSPGRPSAMPWEPAARRPSSVSETRPTREQENP